jgi:Ca2+-binding EF-hand superfamily protein
VNYKDKHAIARKEKSQVKKELNFSQIKDYLYIFTQLDKDSDGYLTLDEIKQAFSASFSNNYLE